MSISMQRVMGIALALAMILCPFGAVAGASSIPGDTNSDRRVDVLDYQAVVAAVFGQGPKTTATDVNGDGRVDVLDLQRALELSEGTAPLPRIPDTQRAPAIPAPGVVTAAIEPIQTPLTLLMLGRADACSTTSRIARQPDGKLRRATARYVYGLTPNAPPLR